MFSIQNKNEFNVALITPFSIVDVVYEKLCHVFSQYVEGRLYDLDRLRGSKIIRHPKIDGGDQPVFRGLGCIKHSEGSLKTWTAQLELLAIFHVL